MLILNYAAAGKDYQSLLSAVIEIYGTDFDGVRLESQFQLFAFNFRKDNHNITLKDINLFFKSLTVSMYSEVVTLLKIILVMPATNSLSEQSFSCLRRIKTYLRLTMSQERLNHCMLLNIYKEETDSINLIDITNTLYVQNIGKQFLEDLNINFCINNF